MEKTFAGGCKIMKFMKVSQGETVHTCIIICTCGEIFKGENVYMNSIPILYALT